MIIYIWEIFANFILGCVEDLGLYFTTDEEAFGTVTSHELKYVGFFLRKYNETFISTSLIY